VSTTARHFMQANGAAEIVINAAGSVVSASNRGTTASRCSMSNLSCSSWRSRSTRPRWAKTPRQFTLDPDGRFLLVSNQDSDNTWSSASISGAESDADPVSAGEQPRPVCWFL